MANNIFIEPPPGLDTDDTSFSAEGQWRSGSNVRFWKGKPQVIGGWTVTGYAAPASGTPSKLYEWTRLDGTTRYFAMATTTALYVGLSGTFFTITPTGLGTVTRWSLEAYGETLMASPSGGKLYQWSNNTGVAAAEITQAPDNITCILVTNERQILAFGCNEEGSGTFNSLCIRGSDLEDPTDWTTTATNNAFEHILVGSGSIVSAKHVGDFIGIWTTDSLFMGQFIGDPAQTYRFERVGAGCGLLGMDAVVCVNGTVYWITPDYQFFVWTPGMDPQPMKCPLVNTFQGEINTNKSTVIERTFAFYNTKYSEVWFFYCTGSSSSAQPTKYIAVSTIDGSWFTGAISRTAMHQGLTSLYGASSARVTYVHESGKQGVSASPLSWSLTSGAFYGPSAERDIMLKDVWGDFGTPETPQFGTVTVTFSALRYPLAGGTGNVTGSQAVDFTTSTTRKNLRLSGRLITVQLSGNDTSGTTDTFMRFGKLAVGIAAQTGQR